MNKLCVGQIINEDFADKLVLVRTDFNVPLQRNEHGGLSVTNDARIKECLETLHYLLQANARVVICTSAGRPMGQADPGLSLRPIVDRLQHLLGGTISVQFAGTCIGVEAERAKARLTRGKVLVLENLRFHQGEEQNEESFARQLAHQIDIYVNEAFSTSHRAHASICGIAKFVKHRVAGFALHRELLFLHNTIANPRRPFGAIVGGVKVSTKIDVVLNLLDKVDVILIGGAMAFTFYKAMGLNVGDSFVELASLSTANDIMRKAADNNVHLCLPRDFLAIPTEFLKVKHPKVLSTASDRDIHPTCGNTKYVKFSAMEDHSVGVDIGPETVTAFEMELRSCNTIIYNGPMGMFEVAAWSQGTQRVLQLIENRTAQGCITIVCGGDTIAAADGLHCTNFSHVSSGGGAALELLGGKSLPGVAILSE